MRFKKIILLPLLLLSLALSAQQAHFSLSTDFSLLRSFKKDQHFWSAGQAIIADWHFNKKDGIYTWLSYYSKGHFANYITATAKLTGTQPQQFDLLSQSLLRPVQISVGWKRYLRGTYDVDGNWNLYISAGYGLMFGQITNNFSAPVDTTLYSITNNLQKGSGHFKRLTLDLGAGFEVPIGIDLYLYTEGRTWLPISDYPSNYLFLNKNAPLMGTFSIGVRMLFD